MKSKILFLVGILSLIALTGCVTSGTHDELQGQYDSLKSQNDATNEKAKEMGIYLAELEQKLGKASSDKNSMATSLTSMKQALSEATERRKVTDRRMMEYRQLLRRFKTLTDTGQLSVKIVDGRMVVAMPSDILFKSGSARLSKKGNVTIKRVSEVLNEIADRNYQVEGHTDNVPIRTKRYPSNWELASARAINVLKTMVSSGMSKTRISAASFSSTRPFQANTSNKGKQANRRIEIVVVPDLSLLPGYDELRKLSSDQQ